MLDKLIELGIRDIDINNIKEFIDEDNLDDFKQILSLLTNINCSESMIRNIIIGNPFILQRNYEDVSELINYMISLGFKNCNIIFDSYPLFLNKDKFEIEEYINKEQNKNIDDIIDEIESNPIIIDEF